MKTVSIVLPVYNEIRFIARTLQSAIEEADEIIVCDNASTDGTSEICSGFAARHPRIKYIRHDQNIGAGKNFEFGIERATGEYLRILGGHDVIFPGTTQSMSALMERDKDTVLVFPGYAAFLNRDYSIIKNTAICDCWQSLMLASPFERTMELFLRIDGDDYNMYYGLYRRDALQKVISVYSIYGFLSDSGTLFGLAACGKIARDERSTSLMMMPRDNEASELEMLKRIARATSGGYSDNPFFWPFMITCELYGLALEMQAWDGAPGDFAETALELILRRFTTRYVRKKSREGFPDALPGRAAFADEVFNIVQEYKDGKKTKARDKLRLMIYELLGKLPEFGFSAGMRRRLEEKLRRKQLID